MGANETPVSPGCHVSRDLRPVARSQSVAECLACQSGRLVNADVHISSRAGDRTRKRALLPAAAQQLWDDESRSPAVCLADQARLATLPSSLDAALAAVALLSGAVGPSM
jgi:hypothetical protein